MTVTYENNFEDAVAWTAACWRLLPSGRTAMRRCYVEYTLWPAAATALTAHIAGAPLWFTVLLGAVTAGSFLVWLWSGRHTMARRTAAAMVRNGKLDGFLGHTKFDVEPWGVRIARSHYSSTIEWRALERVVIGDEHLFVFYAANRFWQIPRRAFRSDAEMHTFLTMMERYRAKTGNAPLLEDTALVPATSAPWWRSRDSVDTGAAVQVNRRA